MPAVGTFAAFGVRFASDLDLPAGPDEGLDEGLGTVDCRIHSVTTADLVERFSGPCDPEALTRSRLGDGRWSRIERGVAGDHRLAFGDDEVLWLSPDHDELASAPPDPDRPDDPAWQRYLLDTGLGFVALARGYEALHAGAVVTSAGVVAIAAGEGGGKSTLLAELLRRGLSLFADDLLMLGPAGAVDTVVVAHPGPPLMNLPPVLADGRPAAAVGRVLAELDGECWVAVDRPAPTPPAPVAAVVLLERGGGDALSVTRLAASPLALLRHSLQGGGGRDRVRARFEVCSSIAATAAVLQVQAPSDLPATAVVDALQGMLGLTELGDT